MEALKRLCDDMSGDILELKSAIMASSPPTTNKQCHEDNNSDEVKFVITDEDEETIHSPPHNHISVSDVLQRPTFRQASASTFLCPDNIPGKIGVNKPRRQSSTLCKQSWVSMVVDIYVLLVLLACSGLRGMYSLNSFV